MCVRGRVGVIAIGCATTSQFASPRVLKNISFEENFSVENYRIVGQNVYIRTLKAVES